MCVLWCDKIQNIQNMDEKNLNNFLILPYLWIEIHHHRLFLLCPTTPPMFGYKWSLVLKIEYAIKSWCFWIFAWKFDLVLCVLCAFVYNNFTLFQPLCYSFLCAHPKNLYKILCHPIQFKLLTSFVPNFHLSH